MSKICSFFGHRKIENKVSIKREVTEWIEKLIEEDFSIFLFGGFGEFDELCYEAVSALKGKYAKIKRIYCLIDERHLSERKRPKYLRTEDYEEFIYLAPSFDYWYTRIYYRNCEMIEKSDFVIVYAETRKDSGAYKALQYAVKHKKKHINLFDNKEQ